MKPTFSYLAGGALLAHALPAAAQPAQPTDKPSPRPNIIYIMADDHAVQGISAYGHPLSKIAPTPQIDRLAAEGVLFDRAYCSNSISGPSRAVILTGKHSHRNGFLRNDRPFDGEQQTLPKILQANGYRTAVVGKWHLGSLPTGFDYWKILVDQGVYYNPDFILTGGDTVRTRGYVTDIITDNSIEWIAQQRRSEQPFFLMVHHKAPHRNWQPAMRHLYRYENTQFPLPETLFDDYRGRVAASRQEMAIAKDLTDGYDLKLSVGKGSDQWIRRGIAPVFGNMDPRERADYIASYRAGNDRFYDQSPIGDSLVAWKYQRYLRDYFATVAAVDEGVGKLLDYLDRTGLAENTIVVYASDQSFYLGEHGWFDKRFMYEESMRMPLLMRFPKAIPAGSIHSELIQNIDFAPTFLDFCGISVPSDMQGESFRALVDSTATPPDAWRTSLYYRYYENPGVHNVMQHAGVKTERWKLIYFFDNLPAPKEYYFELYDLESDPHEMHNLYGSKGTQKIARELTAELKRLAAQYQDTLPPCKELR